MRRVLEEPRRLGVPARVNVLAQNEASLKLCERIGFVKVGDEPPFVRLEWRAGSHTPLGAVAAPPALEAGEGAKAVLDRIT